MRMSGLVDKDLLLSSYSNGFKLSTPVDDGKIEPTIKDFLHQDFSVFIINTNSELQLINRHCAQICGFDSEGSALGKTAFDFMVEKSANEAVLFDREVFTTRQTKMVDQEMVNQAEMYSKLLSIRSPLFDYHNNLVGLVGFSIVLNVHSLAESVSKLANLGILKSTKPFHPSKKLSSQQSACAKLLLEGHSYKRIAAHLGLSPRTVETYIEQLKIKLNCRNKAELISKLITEGGGPGRTPTKKEQYIIPAL
jgi:DNA-binding CsgD family transcriptional regulator